MADDPRLDAARYRLDRIEGAGSPDEVEAERVRAEKRAAAGAQERAAYVEQAIQQAMRRGDFDDLPGAGKPLQGLREVTDPDWWIRRKIERESLTGLGPPAFTLRTESAALGDRMDGLHREDEVRDLLLDFNRRVVEARRQLLGGPPVVTPTRDVEAEVDAWNARRLERLRAAAERAARAEAEARRQGPWWRRVLHRAGRCR
jgi:hypothetical protein